MDSEIVEWLKRFGAGVLAFAFAAGGLVTYVKRELRSLKAGQERLEKRQDMHQTELESVKSKLVRPEDIKILSERMVEMREQQEASFERFERHQKEQLALITKLVDVALAAKAHK